MTFTGLIAYPITPFLPGGGLDLESLETTVARLSRSGVDGVVVLGTAGSFAYLSSAERALVVRTAVGAASGSGTPVGAGIAAITTRDVLDLAYSAENNGADGLVLNPLSHVPLVSQEIADQVETVASSVSLPLCLYNDPATTGFTYPVELAAELSWLDNVVAFKDTVTSARLFHSRLARYAQLADPETVHGVSGDSVIVREHPSGAWHTGLAAVLAPELVAFHHAVLERRIDDAARWSDALTPVIELMERERPLSALYALAEVCGVRTGTPRRPLLPIPRRSKQALADAVRRLRATAPEPREAGIEKPELS